MSTTSCFFERYQCGSNVCEIAFPCHPLKKTQDKGMESIANNEITLLGISEKATKRANTWDLIALSDILNFSYFPQNISGRQLVLAFDREFQNSLQPNDNLSFIFEINPVGDSSSQTITMSGGFTRKSDASSFIESKPETISAERQGELKVPIEKTGRQIYAFALIGEFLVLEESIIKVSFKSNDHEFPIGDVHCRWVEPNPLSEEELRAAVSRLGDQFELVFKAKCNVCGNLLEAYSKLVPNTPRSKAANSAIPAISELADKWSCSCNTVRLDLRYLKHGHHDAFRYQTLTSNSAIGAASRPLTALEAFQHSKLLDISREFQSLIASSTLEEPVQKLLEKNPVIWSFLSPQRIWNKPPILATKKADFAILDSKGILHLVEIEKPSTRLLNKDGSISREITKGSNQISDWNMKIVNHRSAVLAELQVAESSVHDIRYILIGGMARNTDFDGMTKIKHALLAPKTVFMTFDELGAHLSSLLIGLSQME